MLVYRVCRSKYARDLTGEGSRLKGGRWNHKKTPCIYTSASRSLAILEYTVNVNIDEIPRALSIITISIPEESMYQPSLSKLPGNWTDIPTPSATKDFGTSLLVKNEFAVIQLPSVIIPQEFNFILNCLHPFSNQFKVKEVADFVYDTRIKLI